VGPESHNKLIDKEKAMQIGSENRRHGDKDIDMTINDTIEVLLSIIGFLPVNYNESVFKYQ